MLSSAPRTMAAAPGCSVGLERPPNLWCGWGTGLTQMQVRADEGVRIRTGPNRARVAMGAIAARRGASAATLADCHIRVYEHPRSRLSGCRFPPFQPSRYLTSRLIELRAGRIRGPHDRRSVQ